MLPVWWPRVHCVYCGETLGDDGESVCGRCLPLVDSDYFSPLNAAMLSTGGRELPRIVLEPPA